MFDALRRQLGRLFFFLLLTGILHGQGPATTVVSDVVFRADGTRGCGDAFDFVALVCHGERGSGGSGNEKRNARTPGCAFCRFDSEGRRDSSECFLHKWYFISTTALCSV